MLESGVQAELVEEILSLRARLSTLERALAIESGTPVPVAENLEPELAEVVDCEAIRSLLDDFYALSGVPVSILDLDGRVVAASGWQDVCTKFHRAHPLTRARCVESVTELAAGIANGDCRLFRCKNNMWVSATPIVSGGRKLGTLCSGQFAFEHEEIDRAFFRRQAEKFGFDEAAYLAALDRLPRASDARARTAMSFLVKLSHTIALLTCSNLRLARSLAERAQLAASLEESSEFLNRAQEIALVGSWKLDLVHNCLSWSDQVYRIFGLAPQQFGATYEAFLERVHPDDREAVNEAYSGSVQDGKDRYEISHRIVRADSGEIRWVHEKCEHFRDSSGAILRSIGMVQDITENRRAQEELQQKNDELVRANRELEEFAFVVSHDLKEPLRMINIYAQLLLRRPGLRDDKDAKEFVAYISGGVTRMSELIRDLLKYSRALHEEQDEAGVADLSRSMSAALNVLRAQIEEADATVTCEELPKVAGDEMQYAQVFQNLLSNALNYRSKERRPVIAVSAMRGDGEWVISVQDNGIGFAPEHAERIFGLFKRLHKSAYPGTGLGLAICRRIVLRYGGRIWAETDGCGRGATFRVALKEARADAPLERSLTAVSRA